MNWNEARDLFRHSNRVAPSRVRELKQEYLWLYSQGLSRRTLTGAWIETGLSEGSTETTTGRTLTGAWIETDNDNPGDTGNRSHPHGCVNWNMSRFAIGIIQGSHPHGCVNWNSFFIPDIWILFKSHPHGCVNWNKNSDIYLKLHQVAPSRVRELKLILIAKCIIDYSRTLTGAWIETDYLELKVISE